MKYRYLLFDFDGVLAETNEIRVNGFMALFNDYSEIERQELKRFVLENGGLSRYAKIRYFLSEILGRKTDTTEIQELAAKYSCLVKQKTIDASPVAGSLTFLKKYSDTFIYAIISGADQAELISVCKDRKIGHYFEDIIGSPTEKTVNIKLLLKKKQWEKSKTLYIGDSMNDYTAATENSLRFIGRNSGLTDWNTIDGVPFFQHYDDLMSCIESL